MKSQIAISSVMPDGVTTTVSIKAIKGLQTVRGGATTARNVDAKNIIFIVKVGTWKHPNLYDLILTYIDFIKFVIF